MLGVSPKEFIAEHGRGTFWKRLAAAGDFYRALPEMPDAGLLFDAVRHLQPTILTGLPLGKWAAPQKVEWAAEHFPGVPIITCLAADKHKHMHPGDVLVDDRLKHRDAYEAAGVVFVHHQQCRGQPQAAGEDISVGEASPKRLSGTRLFLIRLRERPGLRRRP